MRASARPHGASGRRYADTEALALNRGADRRAAAVRPESGARVTYDGVYISEEVGALFRGAEVRREVDFAEAKSNTGKQGKVRPTAKHAATCVRVVERV